MSSGAACLPSTSTLTITSFVADTSPRKHYLLSLVLPASELRSRNAFSQRSLTSPLESEISLQALGTLELASFQIAFAVLPSLLRASRAAVRRRCKVFESYDTAWTPTPLRIPVLHDLLTSMHTYSTPSYFHTIMHLLARISRLTQHQLDHPSLAAETLHGCSGKRNQSLRRHTAVHTLSFPPH